MKKYLILIAFIPSVVVAQSKLKQKVKTKKTVATKTAVASSEVKKSRPATGDRFVINGIISGYADGTPVNLLNPNNGQPESSSTLKDGKFSLTGMMPFPDFRLISVNNEQRYISLYLDNSAITLVASKENLEAAEIKGSPANDDFIAFQKATKPYEQLINQQGRHDAATTAKATTVLEKFVEEHPEAYVSPLAIYRHFQINSDAVKLESMFNTLAPGIRNSPIGNYLSSIIAEEKKFPVGQPLADFNQADADGKMISLSSFKGKYVLVDFWASWCGPCRNENPNLVRTFEEYKNKNFTIFGISLDKDKQKWLDAVAADNLTWIHVSDLKGWGNEVAQKFGINSIPQNFLLDPEGRLIARNLRGAALENKLASIIK